MLNNRVTSAVSVSCVVLKNWNLYFHKRSNKDKSAKCNIIKTDSLIDMVHGVIYQFDSGERNKLDKAEAGYIGKIMVVGGFENVLVYQATENNIDNGRFPYT